MAGTPPIAGPDFGLHLRQQTCVMIAHAALAKGDVVGVAVTVDANSGVFTTTAAVDAAGDDPDAQDVQTGIFLIALESIASGAKGKFAVSGILDAKVNEAVDAGDALGADATGLNKADALDKVCGFALETIAAAGTVKVMFDGLNTFGTNHA